MDHDYRLIRLRTGTVIALKDLMTETASVSLDALIWAMIKKTRSDRESLRNEGWENHPSRIDAK